MNLIFAIVLSLLAAGGFYFKNQQQNQLIEYGQELFVNTAYHIGPRGIVGAYTGNFGNCQNCHYDAGTRRFGNHLLHTFANYPQYRSREGRKLSLEERINNCVERPHNGSRHLATDSREMKAMVAYIASLSEHPLAKTATYEDRLVTLSYPEIAASPTRGEKLYRMECAKCHGLNGEGRMRNDGVAFLYPALWGAQSYELGSSMSRISKAASIIKANMPFGISPEAPVLSDIDALDLAAFINDPKHPRPSKNHADDFPNIADKPFDYPRGPYADSFPEAQHRLGPFRAIIDHYADRKIAAGYDPG